MSTKSKPNQCKKCGSKHLVISWCCGPRLTGIGNGHGFLCKTKGEHFHYYCKDCGYAEH